MVFGFLRSQGQVLDLHVDRILFLMEYLQRHVNKKESEVIQALRRDLLFKVTEPKGSDWPDPSNANIGIYIEAMHQPGVIDHFRLYGRDVLEGLVIMGSSPEPNRIWWTPEISPFGSPTRLAHTVRVKLKHAPGWENMGMDDSHVALRKSD